MQLVHMENNRNTWLFCDFIIVGGSRFLPFSEYTPPRNKLMKEDAGRNDYLNLPGSNCANLWQNKQRECVANTAGCSAVVAQKTAKERQ